MISDERKKELAKVADEAMAKFIKDLPQKIHNNTIGAISAMLGFENCAYGRWQIDHCNGRTSEISKWIGERAKKLFKNELEKIITEEFTQKLVEETTPAIIKEFKECFKKKVYSETRQEAERRASQYVFNITKNIDAEFASIDKITESVLNDSVSETQLAIIEAEAGDA